jgi:hypothetical protein
VTKSNEVYRHITAFDFQGLFDSVPVDADVWGDEEYEHMRGMSRRNVKAQSFEEFLEDHIWQIHGLADQNWVRFSSLKNLYQESHPAERVYDAKIKRWGVICGLGQPKARRGRGVAVWYNLKSLFEKYADRLAKLKVEIDAEAAEKRPKKYRR